MEQTYPVPYHNRELSWMDFNIRVLEEAMKKENPLMERLRFLAITGSNLDEFFMVRVAGVKAQIKSGYKKPDASGLTPEKLIVQLEEKIHSFMERQYTCLYRSITPVLKKNQIYFLNAEQLNEKQKSFVSDYFHKVLFPVLTPLAVDTSRPFPLLANKSLNIAVRLKGDDGPRFAIVQVPSIMPRFLEVPCEEGRAFVLLEEVIILHLEELFELLEIEAWCPFRITRNSDLDIDDEAQDFLDAVKESIKRRKRGRPVRLELITHCDKGIRNFLVDMLKMKNSEIYELPGPLDLTFFSKFAGVAGFEHLCFTPIRPVYPPADFWGYDDIFEAIREKDRLVHHPYESFSCVVDFVQAAAEDENVLAIKQTLYRVSGNSPIIAALAQAAENGKQVSVLVELKARFDEENNIVWAKMLEKAGCHVIYGLLGLKTHSKITLVVRREETGIRRYVHLGTGNYNDSTAKLYTDCGLLTCDARIGEDATAVFNMLSGYSEPSMWNKLVVAPLWMRDRFLHLIEMEAEHARKGEKARIVAKVNSLCDRDIIAALYAASAAGVQIDLIVRGICCLKVGIPGISENITVRSIVGNFLEHARIFYFYSNGNEEIYMGSADWMPRNLDKRVEIIFPIEDERLKKEAWHILDTQLRDNVKAHILQPDGSYEKIDKRGKVLVNAQEAFCQEATEAAEAPEKIKDQRVFIPAEPLEDPKE